MEIESGVRGSNNLKFPFKFHFGVMGKVIQQPTPGRIGSLVYSQNEFQEFSRRCGKDESWNAG